MKKLPIKFIINELDHFINNFPEACVKYKYDKLSDIHFINITPIELYHLNSSYIQWEKDFSNKFIYKYPDENLYFLSDDAIIKLDKSHFELRGVNYKENINNY